MIAGFLVLLLAGLCQGSFGLGYKKYQYTTLLRDITPKALL